MATSTDWKALFHEKGGERTMPHDPKAQEEPPNHALFRISVSNVEHAIQAVMDIIEDIIGSNDNKESDKDLSILLEHCRNLRKVQTPPTQTLALVGAQASGKSTLLCALFGRQDFADMGGEGSACTRVPTTYGGLKVGDPTIVELVVQIPSENEINEQVGFWIRQFLRSDLSEMDGKIDREVIDRCEHARKQADIFFQESFLHDPTGTEYRNNTGMKMIASGQLEKQIRANWANHIMRLTGSFQQETITERFNNSGHVKRALLQYTKRSHSAQGRKKYLGPILRDIRISADSPLFQQGLTITDLPGLYDVDPWRMEMVSKIRREAEFVLLAVPADRVKSNDSFRAEVDETLATHPRDKIIIVITRCDDLAKRVDVLKAEQYLHDRVMKDLFLAMSEAHDAVCPEGKDPLDFDKTNKSYIKFLEKMAAGRLINILSTELVSEVQRIHRKDGQPDLAVFATDAEVYNSLTEADPPPNIDVKGMTISDTGIPELRRYLKARGAEEQLQRVRTHVHDDLPKFLGCIERAISRPGNQSERLPPLRKKCKARLDTFVKTLAHTLYNVYRQEVQLRNWAKHPPNSKATSEILELVNDTIKNWAIKSPSPTFDLILGNYGWCPNSTRSLNKQSLLNVNWNEEISKHMTPQYERWESEGPAVDKKIHDAFYELWRVLRNDLDNIVTKGGLGLELETKFCGDARTACACIAASYQTLVEGKVTSAFEKTRRQLATETKTGGVIGTFTKPKFERAYSNRVSGRGKTKRYRDELLRTIGTSDAKENIVKFVADEFQANCQDRLLTLCKRLITALEKPCGDFLSLFDIVPNEADMSAEGKVIRNKLASKQPIIKEMVDDIRAMVPPRLSS